LNGRHGNMLKLPHQMLLAECCPPRRQVMGID